MTRNFKSSGNIALKADIQPFFGDNPNSDAALTEFYRGGNNVPNNNMNSGIPTSGNLAMSNFRGATNETYQLRVDAHPVNDYDEGDTVVMTLTTTNVDNGTTIWSRTAGIDIADVVDATSLDFPFIINNNTAQVSFTIKNDFVSEGGTNTEGHPLAGNETATTTLYTGTGASFGGTPIGGAEGAVSWQIVDSSMSWYAKITAPTYNSSASPGPYKLTHTVNQSRTYGYPSEYQHNVSLPTFSMEADFNNPSYSITAVLDSGYGRVLTYSSSLSQSQVQDGGRNNHVFGNGNSYDPVTWSNNTNPSLDIDRYVTFPVNLAEDTDTNAYWMKVIERGRFIFTEIGGQGRVLGSDDTGLNFITPFCYFETIHNLAVTP